MIRVNSVDDLILKSKRVGIFGYPGAGKTTLSIKYTDKKIIHTDDFLKYNHEDRPALIMKKLAQLESFIIEGNEVTRLVNRGLELDALILVTGSERFEPSLRGLKGRVDKFLGEYDGEIYTINTRKPECLIR